MSHHTSHTPFSSSPLAGVPVVLFEDPNVIVVDKPAGLLSQGELRGDPNLVDWLRERFGRPYVGLIHRLDRNTSGVMIVAKRTKAAQRLTEALQTGKICRTYLAWIQGNLTGPVRWQHWLLKDEKENLVKAVSAHHPRFAQAKEALLNAQPHSHGVWASEPVTLAEFVLETGRSHQIRVQSAAQGMPLLGDRKYGGRPDFPRPALHSWKLRFPHPISKEILEFEAPLPPEMQKPLKKS